MKFTPPSGQSENLLILRNERQIQFLTGGIVREPRIRGRLGLTPKPTV